MTGTTGTLRIATRGSALARWQADAVAEELRRRSGRSVELVVIETSADRRLDVSIWQMGGKGVFVKEVQAAVLDGRADLAVHSGKDLPARTPDSLVLAAVPERADPRDVLVGSRLDDLGPGAVVATGSVRRRAQLSWLRPDLTFTGLRGNIATRLSRRPAGGAVLMAAAAIDRLGLAPDLADAGVAVHHLPTALMLPQVAQGALAVECRQGDAALRSLLATLEHGPSRVAVDAERAFLAELGGDCDLPAGAHATVDGAAVVVEGVLASLDGHVVMRHRRAGPDPAAVGAAVARHLLRDAGGATLLAPG